MALTSIVALVAYITLASTNVYLGMVSYKMLFVKLELYGTIIVSYLSTTDS